MAKFCPNCGKEYEGELNFCPDCGKAINKNLETSQVANAEKKKQQMPKGCGCVLSIIVFIILSNLIFGNTNPLSGTNSSLKVLDYKACHGEYGTKMVCGTIINNSDRTLGYAQVEINLYDKAGNLVGSTLSNINNLEPKTKWKFEAPIMEDNVSRFEIKNVTGF